MKKIITLLTMAIFASSTLFSMEGGKDLFVLPSEVRRIIASLALQSEIGWKWEPLTITEGSPVFSAAFSPDGKTILTGSFQQRARLWDTTTGVLLKEFKGGTGIVRSVAFSPDGKTVLTGNSDATVRLWDVDTEKERQQFTGHTNGILSVAFSPDGKTVLSGSSDNTARLWDVETGKELQQFLGHTDAVFSVAFSPDGETVLTGSDDSTARLWDVVTGEEIKQFNLPPFFLEGDLEGDADREEPNSVRSVAFSPDGTFILTGSEDKSARLWSVETGGELQEFVGHTGAVKSVAFSFDGKMVLTGSNDYTARLWNARTGKEIELFAGYEANITSVAFSPDKITLALASSEGTVTLLRLNFTLPPELQQEAYDLFKQKGFYDLVKATPTETSEEESQLS